MSLKYGEIIKQMSLEEKALMMSGKNTWIKCQPSGNLFPDRSYDRKQLG